MVRLANSAASSLRGKGVEQWRKTMLASAAALFMGVPQDQLWPALSGGALLLADHRPAAAQSAEAVGQVAQAITVRIEGATQGSGVLVRREGNRYTVLTAWHVVADQKPGEELDIYAPDGNHYPVEQGSIKRLGEVDMAVLTFTSDRAYTIAITGDPRGLPLGTSLYVSGFPLGTSSVPLRLMRLLRGDLVGNGVVDASRSQHLLYSNPTLPGMSGGAVLNLRAELIGIHISAERADQISESTGKPVATGVNQGLAIGAYSKWVETDSGAIAGSGARLSPSPMPSQSSGGTSQLETDSLQSRQFSAMPNRSYAANELQAQSQRQTMQLPQKETNSTDPQVDFHVVRLGETLSEIAGRYSTTSEQLMQLNGLRSPQDLWAGSRLQVPPRAWKEATQPNPLTMQIPVTNKSLFQALPIDQDRFVVLARPVGQSDWNLLVLEQVQAQPRCWEPRADGLIDPALNRFDFTGICSRYLDSNGYSLRVGDEDLAGRYRLRLEQQDNSLYLVATSPSDTRLVLVGRGLLPRRGSDGYVPIRLEPGWELQRRVYGEHTFYHVYFAKATTLVHLLGRGGENLGGQDTTAVRTLR